MESEIDSKQAVRGSAMHRDDSTARAEEGDSSRGGDADSAAQHSTGREERAEEAHAERSTHHSESRTSGVTV